MSLFVLLASLTGALAAPDLAAIDAEITAAQTELDALVARSHEPRRSAEALARIEVSHAEALLDTAEQEALDRKKAVPVAKAKGTRDSIQEAQEAAAAAKAEVKRLKEALHAAEDVERAAAKEGAPAPVQTPEEAAAEKLGIELATRRLALLKAQRSVAEAELAVEAGQAAVPPADPAPLEAELAARRAEVERLQAELATAETHGR